MATWCNGLFRFLSFSSRKTDEFVVAADSNDDVVFGALDEAAAAELKVEAGKIALFKNFDDGRVDYTGADSAAEINAFVNAESLPLVSEFNDESRTAST